ncbi:MAG: protein kinase [Gemmatimonadota bacterium]|nr:protein kinase [Gemmatimonadota bacterium]
MSESESQAALRLALGERYEFNDVLGVGGMGAVYLARDRKHDRPVAIKTVRPDLTTEPMRLRFRREIEITARLQHPHILALLDSGVVGHTLYFIMPFIRGESLGERLDRTGPLPADEVARIGRDVARGLDAAHQQGVIHRDIKPGNVMLTPTYALIMDFGIAKSLARDGDESITGAGWLGTPAYMAPEQFRGVATAQSDVYGLGAVLYEALTGRRWPSPASGDPPDWSGVQPSLRRVLERALSVEPEDRWYDAAEFEGALDRWDRERGLAAPRREDERDGIFARLRGLISGGRRTAATRSPGRHVVAVLPFQNLNRDPDTEYFCEGITEDVIAQLAKVRNLKVISRAAVSRLKDHDGPIREIGRRLDVGAVLQGSVRRDEGRVRIVSQLTDAATDEHVWTETYDRELTDIFELQSDVARQIARSLDAELASGTPSSLIGGATDNLAAYDLYLKSRLEWNRRTAESFTRSIEHLEGAVAEDPAFGLAYAALAETYVTQGIYGMKPPHEVMPLARRAAERALEIHRDQAEAVAALGSVHSLYEWDWSGAEASYRRATELAPNYAIAHQWYATHVLIPRGRFSEARTAMEHAREIDPLSPSIAISAALVDYYEGKVEPAVDRFRRLIDNSPTFWLARYFLGWALLGVGRSEEAVELFEEASRVSSDAVSVVAALAFARATIGDLDEARRLAGELEKRRRSKTYVSPLRIAQVHAGLGETDEALSALERAAEGRDVALALIDVEHGFDAIRDDPRFEAVRTRVMGPIPV